MTPATICDLNLDFSKVARNNGKTQAHHSMNMSKYVLGIEALEHIQLSSKYIKILSNQLITDVIRDQPGHSDDTLNRKLAHDQL